MARSGESSIWADWSKAIIAAVLGAIFGAGATAYALKPMVDNHEVVLVERGAQIEKLRDDLSKVKEDVSAIRAVVERAR